MTSNVRALIVGLVVSAAAAGTTVGCGDSGGARPDGGAGRGPADGSGRGSNGTSPPPDAPSPRRVSHAAARLSTAARATSGHRLCSPARHARRRRVRRSRCTGLILRPGRAGHIHRAVYIARMTRRPGQRHEVAQTSPQPDPYTDPAHLR